MVNRMYRKKIAMAVMAAALVIQAPVLAEETEAEPLPEVPQETVMQTEAPAPAAETEAPPRTEAPQTEAPQTEAQTEAPQTEAPQTEAETEAPQTEAFQTEAGTEASEETEAETSGTETGAKSGSEEESSEAGTESEAAGEEPGTESSEAGTETEAAEEEPGTESSEAGTETEEEPGTESSEAGTGTEEEPGTESSEAGTETEAAAEETESEETEAETSGETEKAVVYETDFYYENDEVIVTAKANEAAKLPEGTKMNVYRLEEGTAEFNAAKQAAEANCGASETAEYRFYGASFVYNGEKLNPADGTVSIQVQFKTIQIDASAKTQKVLQIKGGGAKDVTAAAAEGSSMSSVNFAI